jgi:hypothetical protein
MPDTPPGPEGTDTTYGYGGLVITCSEANRARHALFHTFARGFIGLQV